MAVLKKASYVVKSAEATWNGILPLSEFDQAGVVTHAPIIYMFEGPPPTTTNQETISCRLRESLSRALVSFYPLAGRVRWIGGGRLELECNAMGAEFIEAESTNEISYDFIGHDFSSSSSSSKMFQKLLPNIDYRKQPIHELPLCLVQLTRFKCGGISIGMKKSHVVKDGHAAFEFVMEWARLARGDDQSQLLMQPYMDRRPLILQAEAAAAATSNHNNIADHVEAFSRLPVLIDNEDEDKDKEAADSSSVVNESSKETAATTLVLTKSQVDKLKKVANANHPPVGGGPGSGGSRKL